uniref:uncharacterized protein LOC117611144 n=1 Tax=Osmia lignaria TaxID=473952 RepID=UPI001478B21D|nr:uncharacterized protein LOC117611144 [Osmia lignaria]
MAGIAWVYRLKKDQVVSELRRLNLPTLGTWVQLRTSLADYVREHQDEFADKPEDEPGYKEEADQTRDYHEFHAEMAREWLRTHLGNRPATATSTPNRRDDTNAEMTAFPAGPSAPPEPAARHHEDRAKTMEIMRKWNCHFDGRDPYAFLEQLEELQEAYGLTDHQMRSGFTQLLRGEAQKWYRNTAVKIRSWQDLQEQLRRFFVPAGEKRRLDQQIASRKQGPDEPLRTFINEITTLMRRRGAYTEVELLDAIYFNMKPAFRLYINRALIKDVSELITRAETVTESMTAEQGTTRRSEEQRTTRPEPRPRTPNPTRGSKVATDYNRETHCWRCGQTGHDRFKCPNSAVRFCSYCGKVGEMTRTCLCARQGNAERGRTDPAPVNQPTNTDQRGSETNLPRKKNQEKKEKPNQPGEDRKTVHCQIAENPRPTAVANDRIIITVRVGQCYVEALLDTGAAASYISDETAEICKQAGWEIEDHQLSSSLANGQEMKIYASYRGQGLFNGMRRKHRFYVMPNLAYPMLIGMDLLRRLGLQVWLGEQRVDRKDAQNQPTSLPVPCTIKAPIGLAELTPDDQEQLDQFLRREKRAFEGIQGPTPLIEHEIRLEETTPIKQRYRPRNPAMQKLIDEEVEKMLTDGVIQPSSSPWSSPIVMVKKKDGKYRFCVDFRKLNQVTRKDAYPLPHVNATLDKLRGARYLSTIDLKNGYWQVPLSPESRPLTAFTAPGRGLMEFVVMPFGLHSAPSTFQRLLDRVIPPEMAPHAFAYLDDIVIVTSTFEEHLRVLTEVFRRLRAAKLRPNWEKCHMARNSLKYLGHIVDNEGLRTDPEKVSAVAELPPPANIKDLRRFLGLLSWYRRFVPDVSKEAAPLTTLLRKDVRWTWGKKQQQAFDELKKRLIDSPVLAMPDWNKTFILQTDASTEGLGAVLTQEDDQGERVIAYASRTLNNAEKNYSATELECLAVKWGIWKMRHYLEGYHFIVVTDHQSLKWLEKIDSPSGRLARWALELGQWDFEIRYRRGPENTVADALSRRPQPVCGIQQPAQGNWYNRKYQEVENNPEDHPEYRIDNGILYRNILHTLDFNEIEPDQQWKICVPENQKTRVLREAHDIPTAGHLGVAKTLARLAHSYYWPGMLREATKYVRDCTRCQEYKVNQQATPGNMYATNVQQPWEMVSADLVGPLPRSKTGNTSLLVIQDRFTKWIELRPLRRATGPAVAKALRELVILRHGTPRAVTTDNGKQFVGKEFEKTLTESGIKHRRTPPYAPQCNPVERANRVIKTMISQDLGKTQKAWDEHLPEIAFAYNTARHDSTGYTPAYLNTGRELTPPGSLQQENQRRTTTPWATRLKNLRDAQELARTRLAQEFQRQQRHYNQRRRNWQPKIGERVWKRTHILSSKADARNAKLSKKYDGPFRVHKRVSPVIFDLRDRQGKRVDHVHVRDLKPVTGTRNTELRKATTQPSGSSEPTRNVNAQGRDVTGPLPAGHGPAAIKGQQQRQRAQTRDGCKTAGRGDFGSYTPPKPAGKGRAQPANPNATGVEKIHTPKDATECLVRGANPQSNQTGPGPDTGQATARHRANTGETQAASAGPGRPATGNIVGRPQHGQKARGSRWADDHPGARKPAAGNQGTGQDDGGSRGRRSMGQPLPTGCNDAGPDADPGHRVHNRPTRDKGGDNVHPGRRDGCPIVHGSEATPPHEKRPTLDH